MTMNSRESPPTQYRPTEKALLDVFDPLRFVLGFGLPEIGSSHAFDFGRAGFLTQQFAGFCCDGTGCLSGILLYHAKDFTLSVRW